MAFPCKNCIERHTDCWSACPKYQAEKEKSQAVLDARKNITVKSTILLLI